MDVLRNTWIAFLCVLGSLYVCDSVDPHYMSRAKILTREEAAVDTAHSGFEPTARRCAKIGEKAARKRFSCVADTQFYETFANRVHMSRTLGRNADSELRDLAYKISKCSSSFSKYFERTCKSKSKYLGDRRRCRRMKSIEDKSLCRMQLRRVYSRRSRRHLGHGRRSRRHLGRRSHSL